MSANTSNIEEAILTQYAVKRARKENLVFLRWLLVSTQEVCKIPHIVHCHSDQQLGFAIVHDWSQSVIVLAKVIGLCARVSPDSPRRKLQ